MSKGRVRPNEVGSHYSNTSLANKKRYEVRVRLWGDQYELIHEWTEEHDTSIANVMRKLANYFLHMNKARRETLLKEY